MNKKDFGLFENFVKCFNEEKDLFESEYNENTFRVLRKAVKELKGTKE